MCIGKLAGRQRLLGALGRYFGFEGFKLLLYLDSQFISEDRCARITIRVFNGVVHGPA
jgi:hypothetical protein